MNCQQSLSQRKPIKFQKVSMKNIRKLFVQELNMRPEDPIIVFSSEKGLGMDQAWAEIKKRM